MIFLWFLDHDRSGTVDFEEFLSTLRVSSNKLFISYFLLLLFMYTPSNIEFFCSSKTENYITILLHQFFSYLNKIFQFCFILYYFVSFYFLLLHLILFYFILFYFIPYYYILLCFILFHGREILILIEKF